MSHSSRVGTRSQAKPNPNAGYISPDDEHNEPMHGRYLSGVCFTHFSEPLNKWRVMATTPDALDAKIDIYRGLIQAVLTNRRASRKLKSQISEYIGLPDKIYAALLGSRGVYYLINTRKYRESPVFAPHIAHTVVAEEHLQIAIHNVKHWKRAHATLKLLNEAADLVTMLRSIVLDEGLQRIADCARLAEQSTGFIRYLDLHSDTIKDALKYKLDETEVLTSPEVMPAPSVPDWLSSWHTPDVVATTPERPSTAHHDMRASYKHPSSVASRTVKHAISTPDPHGIGGSASKRSRPSPAASESCGFVFEDDEQGSDASASPKPHRSLNFMYDSPERPSAAPAGPATLAHQQVIQTQLTRQCKIFRDYLRAARHYLHLDSFFLGLSRFGFFYMFLPMLSK